MKLIDKLLLVSLVVLLPIALFLSQWLLGDKDSEKISESAQLDVAGLEKLIRTTVAQSQPQKEATREYLISEVKFATESGILDIKGTAPEKDVSILVSISFFDTNQTPKLLPTDSNSEIEDYYSQVKGQPVEVYSLLPSTNGQFAYGYKVDKLDYDKKIELRFDQNSYTKTIRFDLKKGQQIL